MYHNRLKLYKRDAIPEWVRRQRHRVLQQCQDPVVPLEHLPEPPQSTPADHSSENGLDDLELEPPMQQQRKGMQHSNVGSHARERRRPLSLGKPQTKRRFFFFALKKILKGREIRTPVRYRDS